MNFIKQFSIYLDSIGLRQKSYHDYEWLVHTIHGPLRVSIHESDFTKSGQLKSKELASIYCQFQNDKCEEFLKIQKDQIFVTNRKWNFHVSGGESDIRWNTCFINFKNKIEKIKI